MPLWALIYILVMSVFSIYSHYDHFKHRERVYYVLLDVIVDVATILMFIAYWHDGLVRSISNVAPFLFLFCLSWILGTAPYIYERHINSMSETEKRKMTAFGRYGYPIFYVLTFSSLSIPLLVFAGRAAFRYH